MDQSLWYVYFVLVPSLAPFYGFTLAFSFFFLSHLLLIYVILLNFMHLCKLT